MQYEIDEAIRSKAKTPHELFMFNLGAFHLLLPPLAINLHSVQMAFLLPLVLSMSVISYIFLRARQAQKRGPWFTMVHWKLALRRSTFLLIAYAISGAIMGLAYLVAHSGGPGDTDTHQRIIMAVFERFAVMPTFIAVLVTFVMESGSIYQAGRGEVPTSMVKRFPPPPSAHEIGE